MRKLQAVVFDMDDTLYPEREYVYSGFRAVASWVETNLGVPWDRVLKELWQIFIAENRKKTFDIWLTKMGLAPEAWVPQMIEVYRSHQPRIKPYPGVSDLLVQLRRIYRLGLVTDGCVSVQKKKLEALGLSFHFDAIVFSDAWGKEARKPNSRPFRAILEQLGVNGPEAVYVGDNPLKDFLGARDAGMWTVRVRRSNGLYSHLSPPSAEYASHVEITDLNDLEKALARIEEMAGHGLKGAKKNA